MTLLGDARAPGLDTGAVSRWITDALDDVVPPLRFGAIGHGRSNLTFRVVDASGRALVLRRPPLGVLLASAHDVSREYRVLARLAAAGAPVPRPLALCTDPAVTGADFFVMEHVDGVVLDREAAAATLDPAARAAAGASLVSTLAGLHALDVDTIGLGRLSRRDGYAARQLKRWHGQWERTRTHDDPRVDRIAERLAAAAPEQRESTLVHGDYRLDNVIVDAGGTVRAVLDWELCTLGDPLADLGLLVAYTPSRPSEVLPIHDELMLLPGMPSSDALVAGYAAASRRSLDALPFWVALGCWKIAIILQGVHRRWLDEPANRDPAVGPLEPAIGQLLERAEQLIWKAGW